MQQSQIIYKLSLLDRPVVIVVAPLLDSGILPCSSVHKLVTILETLYGDPDR
jgi:hypothetical protein